MNGLFHKSALTSHLTRFKGSKISIGAKGCRLIARQTMLYSSQVENVDYKLELFLADDAVKLLNWWLDV